MKKKLAVLLSAALLALGVPVGLGASAADFVPDFLCTYPAEGSELEMEAFDISWEPVDGAVKYQVNLKNTDTGEYVLELVETNGTSISAPMDGLQQKGAGNYIVAVSAELADGSKKYSSRPTFTIKEPAEKQYFIGGAKVVAFGDSLVANGWEEEWSPVWANMLWQRFGFAELVNAGVPGNTTTQGLARFDTDVAVHSDADFVLIVFGMNDHAIPKGGSAPQVDLETFRQNLSAMADKVAALGARPVFVTPSYIDEEVYKERHPEEFLPPYEGGQKLLDTYSEVIREVAADKNADLIDMAKACQSYDKAEFLQEDGVHLAAGGQEAYAKVIGDYLAERYPGGQPVRYPAEQPGEENVTIPDGGFDLMPKEGVTTSPEGLAGSNGKLIPVYNEDGSVTLRNESQQSWPGVKTEYHQTVNVRDNPIWYAQVEGLQTSRNDGFNSSLILADGTSVQFSDVLGQGANDVTKDGIMAADLLSYLEARGLVADDGTIEVDSVIITYATWSTAEENTITLRAFKLAGEEDSEPTGGSTNTTTGSDGEPGTSTQPDASGTPSTGGQNPPSGETTGAVAGGLLLAVASVGALRLSRRRR